eukprot:g39653.t1
MLCNPQQTAQLHPSKTKNSSAKDVLRMSGTNLHYEKMTNSTKDKGGKKKATKKSSRKGSKKGSKKKASTKKSSKKSSKQNVDQHVNDSNTSMAGDHKVDESQQKQPGQLSKDNGHPSKDDAHVQGPSAKSGSSAEAKADRLEDLKRQAEALDQAAAEAGIHSQRAAEQQPNAAAAKTDTTTDIKKSCLACQRVATSGNPLKICSKCKAAWFCDVQCQKQAWKQHKPDCTKAAAKLTETKQTDTKQTENQTSPQEAPANAAAELPKPTSDLPEPTPAARKRAKAAAKEREKERAQAAKGLDLYNVVYVLGWTATLMQSMEGPAPRFTFYEALKRQVKKKQWRSGLELYVFLADDTDDKVKDDENSAWDDYDKTNDGLLTWMATHVEETEKRVRVMGTTVGEEVAAVQERVEQAKAELELLAQPRLQGESLNGIGLQDRLRYFNTSMPNNIGALVGLHRFLNKNQGKLVFRRKAISDYGWCQRRLISQDGQESIVVVSRWGEAMTEASWTLMRQEKEHYWLWFRDSSGVTYYLDLSALQYGLTSDGRGGMLTTEPPGVKEGLLPRNISSSKYAMSEAVFLKKEAATKIRRLYGEDNTSTSRITEKNVEYLEEVLSEDSEESCAALQKELGVQWSETMERAKLFEQALRDHIELK